MLCTRPQPADAHLIERPYCFRVTPPEQLGLCPTQKMRLNHSNKNKACEYLQKHKKWIRDFQVQIAHKKDDLIEDSLQDEWRKLKIKDIAQKMRDDIRSDNFNDNPKYLNSLYRSKIIRDSDQATINDNFDPNEMDGIAMDDYSPDSQVLEDRKPQQPQVPNLIPGGGNPKPLSPQASPHLPPKPTLKKKKLPAYAMTSDQHEEFELEECDQLLNFFDNTNYGDYIDDLEIRNMVGSIKKRVDELKKEPNWQAKWNERLEKIKAKKREQKMRENIAAHQNNDDDMIMGHGDGEDRTIGSGAGGNMFGGSVASDRTKESVEGLREKMRVKGEKGGEWDARQQNRAQAVVLEERLAKHIADELLRNNMVRVFFFE